MVSFPLMLKKKEMKEEEMSAPMFPEFPCLLRLGTPSHESCFPGPVYPPPPGPVLLVTAICLLPSQPPTLSSICPDLLHDLGEPFLPRVTPWLLVKAVLLLAFSKLLLPPPTAPPGNIIVDEED